jgi:hypothetical protein
LTSVRPATSIFRSWQFRRVFNLAGYNVKGEQWA